MKVSRVIKPRFGVDAGADDVDGRAAAPGTVLEPGGSSAMILRIDERISSMLGSALVSSLDIPYLFTAETSPLPGKPALNAHRRAAFQANGWPPIADMVAGCKKTGNDSSSSYPRSSTLSRR